MIRNDLNRRRNRKIRKFLREHEWDDDCLDVINAEVLALQKLFDEEGLCDPPNPNGDIVAIELAICERLHRRAYKKLLNPRCLAKFKKMKFYYLDEDGYYYNYEALARIMRERSLRSQKCRVSARWFAVSSDLRH